MRHIYLAWLLAALVAWVLPGAARAEPRFAVREGTLCAACHVNQYGGGMRNAFGASFAQTNLGTTTLPGPALPRLGDVASVGTNLRLASITTLAAHTELETEDKIYEWDSETSSSFEMREGNVYLAIDAIPGRLTFYVDETVAPEGASAREAMVIVRNETGAYVKAGRFMLPYGLRLQDDEAFIRQQTGFTYANQDLGVEVGYNQHPWSAAVAVSNGSGGGGDPNLPKQVTGSLAYANGWGRVGVSGAYNDTSDADFMFKTITGGAHGGLRLGRIVQMGEFDWIRGVDPTQPYDQAMFFTETDLEVAKSAWLRFVFEAYDPLRSMENNEKDRFIMGVSWFPVQLLEVRGEYRLNRDIPQLIDTNADDIVVELHGFL